MKSKKTSILVVDDDPAALETLAELLVEAGYRVLTATGGQQALEMLKQQTGIDLIVSDLMMPEINGIALTKEIHSMELNIPIIVITGFATIELAVETMKAGAADFITRPFNNEQIKITIKKVLETKRLQKLAGEREFYKQLSNRDEMTGLANYRSCHETLEKETERAKRYSRPLTIMMIDIDDFKGCNDTYGHLAGDAAMMQIAGLIKKQTRTSDVVARYGGEEFMVILPEATIEEASFVAERIRQAIEAHPFVTEEGAPMASLTVTIGLSSLPDRASTKKDLIRTADIAMYKGKTSGKNKVVIFE
ncbi:MAG: diguanylate cyclase [Deltaproteobacteria bacterium]|nr:diguanylate cyclase [Deltaproteobacteria bacterium]